MNTKIFTFDDFLVDSKQSIILDKLKTFNTNDFHKYSPISFFGNTGVGKTYILHAIKNKLNDENPGFNCMYISAEAYVEEFVCAVKERKITEFKLKYRNLDAIFIDNFDFLQNREAAQEELLFTISSLMEKNSIIVIASEKPLKKLRNHNERLINSLLYGLSIEVPEPTKELKILKAKKWLSNENIILSISTIKSICSKSKTMNEVEGSIKQIILQQKN